MGDQTEIFIFQMANPGISSDLLSSVQEFSSTWTEKTSTSLTGKNDRSQVESKHQINAIKEVKMTGTVNKLV